MNRAFPHSSSALQEHSHSPPTPPPLQTKFRCPLCVFEFTSRQNLSQHLNQKHSDRPHKCTQCERSYVKKSSLKQHISNYHDNPGSYICGVCNKKFNRKDFLDKHMHRHSEAKEFNCSDCEKSFKTKSSLSAHVHGVHKKERQYVCDACGFRTNWNSAYLEHAKVHSDKPRKSKTMKLEENVS